MDKADEIGLLARIGVLEEIMAMVLGVMIRDKLRTDPLAIDKLHVQMWGLRLTGNLSEDDPRLPIYRASFEERLDALFRRVSDLALPGSRADQK